MFSFITLPENSISQLLNSTDIITVSFFSFIAVFIGVNIGILILQFLGETFLIKSRKK